VHRRLSAAYNGFLSGLKMPKNTVLLPAIHPGEILREEFMKPIGISLNQLLASLGRRQHV
jgi:hypothetical protein